MRSPGAALGSALWTANASPSGSGVAASALRFYEAEGLISAHRTEGGQRRHDREMLRRVSFVRVAQQVGLSLAEIREALSSLPDSRTPDKEDWARLSSRWRPRIDAQIAVLERLRSRLDGCIGCGCLSLQACALFNPEDRLGRDGPGPRILLDDL
jgi:MerR family transcriptional regulator, redox-sensitive transcriptional activator SoxR